MDYSRRSDIPCSRGQEKRTIVIQRIAEDKKGQTTIRTEEELNYKYDWWLYLQIKDLFQKDLRISDFREQMTELETLLMGEPTKIVSKIYKLLLKWYTEDEFVKEQMIK